MRLNRLFALIFVACAAVPQATWALDKHDFAKPNTGTTVGAQSDGDTFATYSVTCTSYTVTTNPPTQVRAAVVDRSRRRLRAQNRSAFLVNIGTSTTIGTSNTWTLGESTNTATLPYFDTYNSGAFYCHISNAGGAGSTTWSATLQLIEEFASQDRSGLP